MRVLNPRHFLGFIMSLLLIKAKQKSLPSRWINDTSDKELNLTAASAHLFPQPDPTVCLIFCRLTLEGAMGNSWFACFKTNTLENYAVDFPFFHQISVTSKLIRPCFTLGP